MNRFFIAGLVLMLFGCSTKQSYRVTATADVNVYEQPIDGGSDVIFVIAKGQSCTVLEEQVQKVFLHYRLQCGDKIGWTYEIEKLERR